MVPGAMCSRRCGAVPWQGRKSENLKTTKIHQRRPTTLKRRSNISKNQILTHCGDFLWLLAILYRKLHPHLVSSR
jgi:hypothetical protein